TLQIHLDSPTVHYAKILRSRDTRSRRLNSASSECSDSRKPRTTHEPRRHCGTIQWSRHGLHMRIGLDEQERGDSKDLIRPREPERISVTHHTGTSHLHRRSHGLHDPEGGGTGREPDPTHRESAQRRQTKRLKGRKET